MPHFWTSAPIPLRQIEDKLKTAFGLGRIEDDSENIWMWFEGRDPKGIHFNVSRGHREGEECLDERLVILLEPIPEDVHAYGHRLATTLGQPIHFGTLIYLGGDEFETRTETIFEPDEEP